MRRRGQVEYVRQGAKIMPADTGNSTQPTWQIWLRNGKMCRLKQDKVLIRSQHDDWEGKMALRADDAKYYPTPGSPNHNHAVYHIKAYPYTLDPETGEKVPTLAIYLGEVGRRTVGGGGGRPGARVAVHLFLLPEGAFIVHPDAFEPYGDEEDEENNE